MKTQAHIRLACWRAASIETRGAFRPGKRQNAYPTDIRCAFVNYVDSLARSGEITAALAGRVTL